MADITINARLVKRDTTSGIGGVKDDVPLGKEYKVIPKSISDGVLVNKVTGQTVDIQIILASNDDGSYGWLPLECLELESNGNEENDDSLVGDTDEDSED